MNSIKDFLLQLYLLLGSLIAACYVIVYLSFQLREEYGYDVDPSLPMFAEKIAEKEKALAKAAKEEKKRRRKDMAEEEKAKEREREEEEIKEKERMEKEEAERAKEEEAEKK